MIGLYYSTGITDSSYNDDWPILQATKAAPNQEVIVPTTTTTTTTPSEPIDNSTVPIPPVPSEVPTCTSSQSSSSVPKTIRRSTHNRRHTDFGPYVSS
jgi:hypothetical protein